MSRIVFALVAVAAVAIAAALYWGHTGVSLDPVAAAATKTAGVSGYRMDFTAEITAAGQHVSMHGTGAADTASKAADIHFDFSGLPSAVSAKGAHGEVITLDQTLYMKMDFLQGQLPPGKSWVELDLGKAAAAMGQRLPPMNQMDPSQWLQALQADANVQRIGTDSVQGEQMTHYHAAIDTSKITQIPASERASVAARMKRLGVTTIPVDVWVDSTGMLRREAIKITASDMSMAMTSDFTSFGAQSAITAPPPGEVLNATKMAISANKSSRKARVSKRVPG